MVDHRVVFALALVFSAAGCGGAAPEPEPQVPEKCRHVHVDRLATDWVAVRGAAADPKTRMRVMEADGGYEAWYIGGFFDRKRLAGVKREGDVQFTEVPDARKKAAVEAGEATLLRAYVKPSIGDCALKVFVGEVDGAGKEQIPPNGIELVQFPVQPGVTFAFQPPSRPLFLGAAARTRARADEQVAAQGGPDPVHEMGTVPVGLFTRAEEDGDPGCTYDMDLYFDDRKLETGPVAAAEPKDGWRHWYHEFDAPYSGNHHFEFHRYRTCEGGNRELLDVAAIEAILQ